MKSAARHHRSVAKTEKRSWTEEETDAVLKGVERWGKGKWSSIKDDPDFGPILVHRTTIDIKDKYRNLMTKKQNQSHRVTVPEEVESGYPKPVEYEPKRVLDAQKAQSHANAANALIGSAAAASTKVSTTGVDVSRKRTRLDDSYSVTAKTAGQDLNQMDVGNKSLNSSKKDSMTLTVQGEKRTLVLNLKGTTKASQLLKFVLKEFQLSDDYTIMSEGTGGTLDLARPLKDQIPLFDLLRVVRNNGK